jgi:hypothetical protein
MFALLFLQSTPFAVYGTRWEGEDRDISEPGVGRATISKLA